MDTLVVLSDSEIASNLSSLPGWSFENGQLAATFKFKDFATAFAFMTMVALAAEKMNHHPDWSNSYGRVVIRLATHDAGGVSELDFSLAIKISQLERRFFRDQKKDVP